jgi:Ca2+/H+ antiporter
MTATPATPTPQNAPAGQDYPGKTLGIVGLILAIFFNLIGLIISAVALSQSRKAGYKNTPALAGVIVGAVLLVIGIIVSIVVGVAAASMTVTTY